MLELTMVLVQQKVLHWPGFAQEWKGDRHE